ncbi:type VI secretion system baseplate subunit TssK [Glaciecola sp. 1036]|uniref:type VI secretion system baseplate subunit TssK n=1 Tax=Alteromonadaceae TaxID=72275 RepID=UPI003D06196C
MTWEKRVVWSEGMMLQPQHFQQQTRYHDAQLKSTVTTLNPDHWGLTSFVIDLALLKTGKLSVTQAEGIMQDGTVFSFPQRDHAPAVIDIHQENLGQIIYLCVALSRENNSEVQRKEADLTRFKLSEFETRDIAGFGNKKTLLEVAGLQFTLRTSNQNNSEFLCIPIAKIEDVSPNGAVSIVSDYLLPSINIKISKHVCSFIDELQNLLSHRSHAIASRVSVAGKSTANELVEFMLLQALNRHSAVVNHLAAAAFVTPFYLFEKLSTLICELSTFIKSSKLPDALPSYQHADPNAVFKPLIEEARQLFSVVLEQNSINIPLQERKFGIRVGTISDKTLFQNASFILAVSADVSPDEIIKHFASQTKIGAVESIKELVNLQLPGVQLTHLAAAPREVPYQRNFVYFELVQSGEYWQTLTQSGGLACHVSANLPGLVLELWAVRG